MKNLVVKARQLVERLSFNKLLRYSEPRRVVRSQTVKGPPLKIETFEDAVFHVFNFKSFPSTTGLRHHGYIKFFKPKSPRSLEELECLVDCSCPDYRYRWAWANKQRKSSVVGPQSMNRALNRAPRKTNPAGRIGLCVAEGERVSTRRGLIPIEQVVVGDQVWTLDGWQVVTQTACTGVKDVVGVTFKSGRTVRVTPEHPVYTFSEPNGFTWTAAGDLDQLKYACVCHPPSTDQDAVFLAYEDRRIKLDATVAELVGYMVAEGGDVQFCNTDERVNNDFFKKWSEVFGNGSCRLMPGNGVYIGRKGHLFLESMGYQFGSYNKLVPSWILRSSREVATAFLRGCYAGDGCFCKKQTTYATVSERLAREMHLLLEFVGIRSVLRTYRSGINKSKVWLLRTSSRSESSKLFNLLNPIRGYSSDPRPAGDCGYHDRVVRRPKSLLFNVVFKSWPVVDDRTEVKVQDINKIVAGSTLNYVTAFIKLAKDGKLKRKRFRVSGKPHSIATVHDLHEVARKNRTDVALSKLCCPTTNGSRRNRMRLKPAIEALSGRAPEAYRELKTLVRDDVSFDQVDRVAPSGTCRVYDLTVANAEHFVVNGVVVHNCKHLIALKDYIRGLSSERIFGQGSPDDSRMMSTLMRYADNRWTDTPSAQQAARDREAALQSIRVRRNRGQLPSGAPPPSRQIAAVEEPETPAGLPDEQPDEPGSMDNPQNPSNPETEDNPRNGFKPRRVSAPPIVPPNSDQLGDSVDNLAMSKYDNAIKLCEELEASETPPAAPELKDDGQDDALSLLRQIRDFLATMAGAEEAGTEDAEADAQAPEAPENPNNALGDAPQFVDANANA